MKHCIVLFLMIFTLTSFSQEKKLSYHFDYYTVYDYKESEKKNSQKLTELAFSNSKDSTYLLTLTIKNDKVKYATLFDHKNNLSHIYKYEGLLKNYDDVRLFNSASTVPYNINCGNEKQKFIYEVQYNSQNKSLISIKTYKNDKNKKMVSELFLETEPSTITQNQQFNAIMFFRSLWCNKFLLSNKEVVKNSYFLVKGKKKYIRKLVEITKTDFTITIDNLKIFQ